MKILIEKISMLLDKKDIEMLYDFIDTIQDEYPDFYKKFTEKYENLIELKKIIKELYLYKS